MRMTRGAESEGRKEREGGREEESMIQNIYIYTHGLVYS